MVFRSVSGRGFGWDKAFGWGSAVSGESESFVGVRVEGMPRPW